MKVIDKDEIRKKKLEKRVRNEIEIHQVLNEKFDKMEGESPIVGLYHSFEDDQNIYLLMEHCDG